MSSLYTNVDRRPEYLFLIDDNTYLYVDNLKHDGSYETMRVFEGKVGEPMRELTNESVIRYMDGGTTHITTPEGELFSPTRLDHMTVATWKNMSIIRKDPSEYDIDLEQPTICERPQHKRRRILPSSKPQLFLCCEGTTVVELVFYDIDKNRLFCGTCGMPMKQLDITAISPSMGAGDSFVIQTESGKLEIPSNPHYVPRWNGDMVVPGDIDKFTVQEGLVIL